MLCLLFQKLKKLSVAQKRQSNQTSSVLLNNLATFILISVALGTRSTVHSISVQGTGSNTKMPQRLKGIREIVDRYDLFLIDMWGVMHDGHAPYNGVIDTVRKLAESEKRMIILSNSSKRKDNSHKMLTKLGFDLEHFVDVITSGEVAYGLLSGELIPGCEDWEELRAVRDGQRRKALVLGSGEGDEEYCKSAGWELSSLQEASLIVARGTFTVNDGSQLIHKRDDPRMYEEKLQETLNEAAKLKIPMLVCNPDKVRPDAERPPMPGRLGADYSSLLGGGDAAEKLVKCVGKPFSDVYRIAMSSGEVDPKRVCMIGDALETDVLGADASGLHSLWILKDGVYGPVLKEPIEVTSQFILAEFNAEKDTYAKDTILSPTYTADHFNW